MNRKIFVEVFLSLTCAFAANKFAPMIGKVLPGKKAALFFQIDKRVGMLIDLQLASEIPLVTQ